MLLERRKSLLLFLKHMKFSDYVNFRHGIGLLVVN